MGIMDKAADLAADQRDAERRKKTQRQASQRERQARLLSEKWGVPATYGGALELLAQEWRGFDRVRVVRRERRDTYLLAGEVRVAFLSEGGHSDLRLIQTCDRHGEHGGESLYPRYGDPDEPGEAMLVAAVAAALRKSRGTCPACAAERERASCPTCGHDLSVPRVAQ